MLRDSFCPGTTGTLIWIFCDEEHFFQRQRIPPGSARQRVNSGGVVQKNAHNRRFALISCQDGDVGPVGI